MRYAAIALCALALAGCGSDDAPTGQVVARVDGVEITQSELNAEIGDRKAPTAAGQKALQQVVLGELIGRRLLANAAREQGLDKTPEAAIAKRRAEEAALIALLHEKIGGQIPSVSADEVATFVADNTDLFANRRIYVVDQILVRNPSPDLLAAMRDVHTLDQAKAELAKRNFPTASAVGVIDALNIPPEMAKQIAALPGNEVFIVPGQGVVQINHIRESQVLPVAADDANRVARGMLMNKRGGQQVKDAINKIMNDGRSKVEFNPAFAPSTETHAKPAAGKPNG